MKHVQNKKKIMRIFVFAEFDIELPMHFMKKISLQLQEDIMIEDFFVSVWIQRMNINSTALNLSLLSSYGTPIVMLENMMFVNVHQERYVH